MSRIHTGTIMLTLKARALRRPRALGPHPSGYDLELRSHVTCTPANCPDAYPFVNADSESDETETDLELLSWERSVDGVLQQAKELFMLRLTALLRHRREDREHRAARTRAWEDTTRRPDISGTD